jgi:hypothetical protein
LAVAGSTAAECDSAGAEFLNADKKKDRRRALKLNLQASIVGAVITLLTILL